MRYWRRAGRLVNESKSDCLVSRRCPSCRRSPISPHNGAQGRLAVLIWYGNRNYCGLLVIRAKSVDTSGLFVTLSTQDRHFRSPESQAAWAKADTNATTILSWLGAQIRFRGLTTAKSTGRGRAAIQPIMPGPEARWSAAWVRSMQLYFCRLALGCFSTQPPTPPRLLGSA